MKDYKELINTVKKSEELRPLIIEAWRKSQKYGASRWYVLYYDWSDNTFFYTEDFNYSYIPNEEYKILLVFHSTTNGWYDSDDDDEFIDDSYDDYIAEGYVKEIIDTLYHELA